MALCVIGAAMAMGAAAPAELTPAQEEVLRRGHGLWKAALARWEAGARAEAAASMKQALTLAERVHGRGSRPAQAAATRLASWQQQRRQWAEAAALLEGVAAGEAALRGGDDWRAIDARWAARTARLRVGWTEKENGEWDEAGRLNGEVYALWLKGRAAEALPLAEKALAIRRRLAGDKHPEVAVSLFNVAAQHQALVRHRTALPLHEEALAIYRATLGGRHPDYAAGLNNLAALLKDMGDPHGAVSPCREALAIRREVLGARSPDYAQSLNSLGLLLKNTGDYKGALRLYRQALALRKEVAGEGHHDYAQSLNNLALLLHLMGDHKAALPLHRQALDIRKRVVGEKHPAYVQSLGNLGALLKDMGDLKGALVLYERARVLTAALLGERHPGYAVSLNNLASLRRAMGDREAALTHLQKARAITKAALGAKHPLYATSLKNLASLLQDMGERGAARPLYEEALVITGAALGEGHPGHALSLNNLAALLKEMGEAEAALPLMERALAIVSATLRDNAAALSDRQQLANAHTERGYLYNRLEMPDLEGHPTAAGHVLAWKGQILVRQQRRRLFVRLSSDAETRAAAARLQAVTRELAAVQQSPAASRARREALIKEQDGAQAALSGLSAAFREGRERGRVTPEALAKALPEGAVLVDYFFHGGRLSAFVYRRAGPALRIGLGPAAAAEAAVGRFLPLLKGGGTGGMPAAPLKRLIWLPLEKYLEGAKVVLVSPDGVLGKVPFAALPGRRPGSYLIEDVAIAVVPVPSALPDLTRPVPEGERHPPSLLVVSGVDYDRAAAARGGDGTRSAPLGARQQWEPLPGAADEAAGVVTAYKARFKGGAEALGGTDAGKPAVTRALARVRYAHLATHGYFAPEAVRSALEPRHRPGMEEREVTDWHPLLLSGLVLSGANKEPGPGEEDGILTALEVSEMDLTRLELAVLSACETGLGKEAGGEGLLGMQRAFQAAGARSVIASLWQVDDRATQALMGDFYKLAWDAEKPLSRVEALRQAQLAMLFGRALDGKPRGIGKGTEKFDTGEKPAKRLPPFYWAAFVLSGDWR